LLEIGKQTGQPAWHKELQRAGDFRDGPPAETPVPFELRGLHCSDGWLELVSHHQKEALALLESVTVGEIRAVANPYLRSNHEAIALGFLSNLPHQGRGGVFAWPNASAATKGLN